MKNALMAVTLSILAAAASVPFAQDGAKPTIAVYVTSGGNAGEEKIFGGRLQSALLSGGLFRTVARNDVFLEQIAKEHRKQRDGSVDKAEIRKLARQYGVQYLCIGDMTPGFGGVTLPVSVVDVVTGEVLSTGDVDSEVASAAEIKNPEVSKMIEAAKQKLIPGLLRALER